MRIELMLSTAATAALLCVACQSSRAETSAAPATRPAASRSTDSATVMGRGSAPVTVKITKTDESGLTRITMELTATADIPMGIARFGVPDQVKVLEGKKVIEIGPLANGETRTYDIVLEATAVGYSVSASVDAILSEHMQLNTVATVVVGAPPPATSETEVIRGPDAPDGVRVERAVPTKEN